MKITILTLFPEMFIGPFDHSILKRAKEKKLISINYINIRDFGLSKHKIVDDKPYGGGVGMILRVDVVGKAIESARCAPAKTTEGTKKCREKVILLDAQGKVFNQKIAGKLSKFDHLILVCAHYEGVDERVREIVDEEISIGDYILTGGEIPAMVVTDSVVRLLSDVLGKDESSISESFQEVIKDNKKILVLEYPQYTRPEEYKNKKVPQVLLSGNHREIAKWRFDEALKKTKKKRPDLLRPVS